MNLPGFAVRRPVTVLMAVMLILALGVVSFTRIGIDLFPELSFPLAAVMTEYQGAAPEEIENLVTGPVEEAVSTVENVERVTSTSSAGNSMVLVEFTWAADMDRATLDVREQLDLVRGLLPNEAADPLVFQFDPSLLPVMVIALGGLEELDELTRLAEDTVETRLERLEGVAAANVTGGLREEILVDLYQPALDRHDLALLEVARALAAANLDRPGGTLEEADQELLVRTVGSFADLEDVASLSLITPRGVAVTPRDLGRVSQGPAEGNQVTLLNGSPALGINVQKQADANTVEVGRQVRAELEALQEVYPDLEVTYVLDQSRFIESAVANVARNGALGAVLAVLVLLLFLRNLRTTLIIATAIPIAVVGTFILIHFAGLTLNLMSLGGVALGLGMLVDSAIVVLENVFRHREEGAPARQAAQEGASEVGMAVTASTLTTVGVFLPIVYVEGMVSQVFQELALTVTFSLLAALLVSLTLIPLLASRLLTINHEAGDQRPPGGEAGRGAAVHGVLRKLETRYRGALDWCLHHRLRVLLGALVFFLAIMGLLPLLETEFLPEIDEGRLAVRVEMPRGTALDRTREVAENVQDLAREIPEVRNIYLSAGAGGGMFAGAGRSDRATLEIELAPPEERERSSREVAAELRQEAARFPGALIAVEARDAMADGGGAGGDPVQVNLRGEELEALREIADDLAGTLGAIPDLENVASTLEEGRPELVIRPRQQRLASLGLDTSTLADTVDAAVEGTVATRLRGQGRETDVRVRLAGETGTTELEGLLLPSATGVRMTLGDAARVERVEGPAAIEREDQQRRVSVSAQLGDRDLGRAMREVDREVQKLELPPGYQIDYGGEFQEMMEAFSGLGLAALLAVLVVYAVLASQFESLVHPFTIMFSVPFAATGAILGLLVFGQSLNAVAAIGSITLTGIVVNNAIVLVDYINTLRRRGLERVPAILEAGRKRLRPILMTTSTTVLALLPLALGWGQGAEMQVPMAAAIIGGLLVSTVLTLFLVPTVYAVLEDLAARGPGRGGSQNGFRRGRRRGNGRY